MDNESRFETVFWYDEKKVKKINKNMNLKQNLNYKYVTVIGAILVIAGFGYARITGKADVLVMFFTFFLGLFLFFIGIAGALSAWRKKRIK